MMDNEKKLELIIEDDRVREIQQQVREMQQQNRLIMVNQILDAASMPNDLVDDDFQHELIELGEEDVIVYDLDVPPSKAFLVEYVGNDWYPGIEYDIVVDGDTILGTIEREIAPTSNPTSIKFLARDNVRWYGSNNAEEATEDRNLGVVTGGKMVPAEVYEELQDVLRQFGAHPIDPLNPELITVE